MRHHLKLLASESAVYGISGALIQLAPLILTPVYGHWFSPSELGSAALVNSALALLGSFLVFALDNSAHRWYWETENIEDRKKTLNTWLWFFLISNTVAALLLLLFSVPLGKALFEGDAHFIRLISGVLVFRIVGVVLTNWFRMQRRPWHVLWFNIINVALTLGTTLYLIIVMNRGVAGIFEAQVIVGAAMSAVGIYFLWEWIDCRAFDWNRLTPMLKYAVPLLPAALMAWLMGLADRWMLLAYLDIQSVGLFQMSSTVAALAGLFIAAFQQAWGPFALSIHNKSESKDVYAVVMLLVALCASEMAFVVSLFATNILKIVATEQYASASSMVVLLAFAQVTSALYYVAAIGCNIAKNNVPISVSLLVGAAVKVTSMLAFIPIWGAGGVALSTLLAGVAMVVYLFAAAQRLYEIPYSWVGGGSICLGFVGIGAFFSWVWEPSVAQKLIMVLTMLVITVWFVSTQIKRFEKSTVESRE